MRGSIEQLEACEQAARVRSKGEPNLVAKVFLKADGNYGWSFSLVPNDAIVVVRFCNGRMVKET